MYVYKRKISNLIQAQDMEYYISNNLNTSSNLTTFLECKKPYQGLYIRNNKIMVENLYEIIKIGDKTYDITNFSTLGRKNINYEYLVKADLENNIFDYDIDGFKYSKYINLVEKEDIMYVEYLFQNDSNTHIKISILPLITYRDLFFMKNTTLLKFNQRAIDDGFLFNLSVIDGQNLAIKSIDTKYNKTQEYIQNVYHEYTNKKMIKQTYLEDVYVPGRFEVNLKANETKRVRIYFSDADFDISIYQPNDKNNIQDNDLIYVYDKQKHNLEIKKNIKQEYVELKDLVLSIDNFDVPNLLIDRIPYTKIGTDDIHRLLSIVKSIEGQYIILKKYDKAYMTILKIVEYIKNIEKNVKDDKNNLNSSIDYLAYIRLKFWTIEQINRLIVYDQKYIKQCFEIIKKVILQTFDDIAKQKASYLNNIDIAALWYNTLKIYQDFEKKLNIFDIQIGKIIENTSKKIVKDFWCEDLRLMKQNSNETKTYATIDMIYVLSLSYQCVFNDIPIKLLDSIFKELYTPYGLRKISKLSQNNDLCVYPMYMAHFVKANLRQNGVTLASQKIAYNLVKELMQDVSKYVNGGVKYVYSEKGINFDYISYDIYTNAEMIRLYDMLM